MMSIEQQQQQQQQQHVFFESVCQPLDANNCAKMATGLFNLHGLQIANCCSFDLTGCQLSMDIISHDRIIGRVGIWFATLPRGTPVMTEVSYRSLGSTSWDENQDEGYICKIFDGYYELYEAICFVARGIHAFEHKLFLRQMETQEFAREQVKVLPQVFPQVFPQFRTQVQAHVQAHVLGLTQVQGPAQGLTQVQGPAQVQGLTQVQGKAQVQGLAQVQGKAQVQGLAQVQGKAQVQRQGKGRGQGKAQVHTHVFEAKKETKGFKPNKTKKGYKVEFKIDNEEFKVEESKVKDEEESKIEDEESKVEDEESKVEDEEFKVEDEESKVEVEESKEEDDEEEEDDDESKEDDEDEVSDVDDDESKEEDVQQISERYQKRKIRYTKKEFDWMLITCTNNACFRTSKLIQKELEVLQSGKIINLSRHLLDTEEDFDMLFLDFVVLNRKIQERLSKQLSQCNLTITTINSNKMLIHSSRVCIRNRRTTKSQDH